MWSIAIHGGAGLHHGMLLPFPEHHYTAVMTASVSAATAVLSQGGSSLDAVTQAVMVMEDSPVFNAGRGSVLNCKGEVQMDASIMYFDGCGGVTGMRRVRNPILAAQLVMHHSPHCFIAGPPVDEFAQQSGLAMCDPSYFITPHRIRQLQAAQGITLDHHHTPQPEADSSKGTVGCVAVDIHGHVAAGTSTGGMVNKWEGRVGDTACIGAGTYATPNLAISCSGIGERFITASAASRVAVLVESGQTLHDAVHNVLDKHMQPEDGGIIAVDRDGNIVTHFTTPGMFRAHQTHTMPEPITAVWS